MSEALAMAVATHPSTLWIDAQKVRLLTSSGLDSFLQWEEVCRGRGIETRFLLNAPARRVVEVLGCMTLLEPGTERRTYDRSPSMSAWLESGISSTAARCLSRPPESPGRGERSP